MAENEGDWDAVEEGIGAGMEIDEKDEKIEGLEKALQEALEREQALQKRALEAENQREALGRHLKKIGAYAAHLERALTARIVLDQPGA